jgi:hypothetical protein
MSKSRSSKKTTLRLGPLEERLEYQNVTDFRQSMLGLFRQLEDETDLRFIVTRGGTPCAVVMSYEAYELLRNIARHASDAASVKTREQRLDDAYLQMAQEEAGETAEPKYQLVIDEQYLHQGIKRLILEGVQHELLRRKTQCSPKSFLGEQFPEEIKSPGDLAKSG